MVADTTDRMAPKTKTNRSKPGVLSARSHKTIIQTSINIWIKDKTI